MKTRKEFPQLLNSLYLLNEGAEIGVQRGKFSECILNQWEGRKLHAIDPWFHQGAKFDISDETQEIHDQNLKETKNALKRFKDRANIIRLKSVDAAKQFADEQLDWVYIDARHDYRSMWADLTAWYSKIRKGGILAGHDYKNSFVRKNLVEVKRAVDAFALTIATKVFSTTDDNLPSWWIVK
jgi:hypothetical protein